MIFREIIYTPLNLVSKRDLVSVTNKNPIFPLNKEKNRLTIINKKQ